MNPVEQEHFRLFSGVIDQSLHCIPQGQKLVAQLGSQHDYDSRRHYRAGRFRDGLHVLEILDACGFDLTHTSVLDIGCGFGGQIAAFLTRRTFCVGLDFIDFDFASLKKAMKRHPLASILEFVLADVHALPFRAEAFDVIFSNSVLEHMTKEQVRAFLGSLRRLLKRDGVAILGLPAALRGIRKDPHYGLPLVSALPAPLKRFVSERACRRTYPWKVRQTFLSSRAFRRRCLEHGLVARSFLFRDSQKVQLISGWPFPKLWMRLLRAYYWDYLILTRIAS